MAGISKAISDNLYNRVKEDLKKSAREGDISRKLQAIKSAKEYGITMVATIYGVSRFSIMNWIKGYLITNDFQLYLAVNDIDHTKTKTRSPKTNGICERFHRTILEEFYRVAFRKKDLPVS